MSINTVSRYLGINVANRLDVRTDSSEGFTITALPIKIYKVQL